MWLVEERDRQERLRQEELAKDPSKAAAAAAAAATQAKYEEDEGDGGIKLREPTPLQKMMRSRTNHMIVGLVVLAIVLPTLAYLLLEESESSARLGRFCSVPNGSRVPCGGGLLNSDCPSLGCCRDTVSGGCYHSQPSDYVYWSEEATLPKWFKPRRHSTPFKTTSLERLRVVAEPLSADSLRIKLEEGQEKTTSRDQNSTNYRIAIDHNPMAVAVHRTDGELLFTTSLGPTMASPRYWEWSLALNADHVFGLGQMHFFTSNERAVVRKVLYKSASDHSTVPALMAHKGGRFYGIYVEHEGALEVLVLRDLLVVLRSLTGAQLSLRLVVGPTPMAVVRQLSPQRSASIPYWALGFHVCRDGWPTNAADAKRELDEFNGADLPYDSDCLHENAFLLSLEARNEQDPDLKLIQEAYKSIKDRGKRLLVSSAPQIPVGSIASQRAEGLNLTYSTDGGKIYHGKYLGWDVVYADWGAKEGAKAWLQEFLGRLGQADGYVLRDNWPANEAATPPSSITAEFPYLTTALRSALSATLPWNARSAPSPHDHADTHNTYGALHSLAVQASAPGAEFILNAAPFGRLGSAPGHGHAQHVSASWVALKAALGSTIANSVFSGGLFSVPVCGTTPTFRPDLQAELCLRWYLTAATLPLMRVSAAPPRRDPTAFRGFYRDALTASVRQRYALLPYFYTVLRGAEPLVRPAFFDFPADNATLRLDEQYMVGGALMVAQPMLPQATLLPLYLPPQKAWFEFWGGASMPQGWIELQVVKTDLVAFVAGGNVLPMQWETGNSAEESRLKPLMLVIALDCAKNGSTCSALGKLQVSDSANSSVCLEMVASKDGVTLANIKAVQKVICGEQSPARMTRMTSIVQALKVYGLPNTETVINDKKPVDLCKVTEDSVTMNYR